MFLISSSYSLMLPCHQLERPISILYRLLLILLSLPFSLLKPQTSYHNPILSSIHPTLFCFLATSPEILQAPYTSSFLPPSFSSVSLSLAHDILPASYASSLPHTPFILYPFLPSLTSNQRSYLFSIPPTPFFPFHCLPPLPSSPSPSSRLGLAPGGRSLQRVKHGAMRRRQGQFPLLIWFQFPHLHT